MVNQDLSSIQCYYTHLPNLWKDFQKWFDNGNSGKIQIDRPNFFYQEVKEDK